MRSLAREYSRSLSYTDLYPLFSNKPVGTSTPQRRILSYVDESLKAITGEEIIIKDQKRFRFPNEIPWSILPEIYLFGLKLDVDMCGGFDYITNLCKGNYSGHGKDFWIYSSFYQSESDAETARSKLVQQIEEIKDKTPRIKI